MNNKKSNTPVSSKSPEKLDRKTVERNRRIHMKGLCFKLTSLVPPHHFQPSKQEQLDQVATYIKQLKERVDELKARKAIAMGNNINTSGSGSKDTNMIDRETTSSSSKIEYLRLPVVELRDLGSSLEVNIVTGLKKNFKLCEVISVLHEEGAEVVSATFSTMGDRVFHTLHAQVKVCRVGVETSRVYQRLQDLVCS